MATDDPNDTPDLPVPPLRLSANEQQWLDWQAWLDRLLRQQILQVFRIPPELLKPTYDINRAMAETQQRMPKRTMTEGDTDGE